MNGCCSTNAGSNAGASCAPATHAATGGKFYRPAVDIRESEREFTIVADVPGAKPEAVDIDVNQGVLTVTANVTPAEHGGARFARREYGVGSYRRSFRLDNSIDAEHIGAELKDGVLTVRLPKASAHQPRKITVKSN
ncbi:MAG TPA: Hsp20/alpha crystallin family protein [Phycisphaerales bacterium]|nr:Hsp20/alpha crystallin family protein [Phycisphaerales bacterium]